MKSSLRAVAAAGLLQSVAAKITWGDCGDLQLADNIDCATIQVPLDYTEPDSTETLDLKLLRVRAAVQPSKGSVIHNFGGPGIVGRATLAAAPSIYVNQTNGEFDVVTFDPRGTGDTLAINCFASAEARDAAIVAEPQVWQPVIAQSAMWDESADTARGTYWAIGKIVAERCYEEHGEKGTLAGTAFTARDVIKIVDALDEDGKLRYWGASYGTVLGATIAYMFPSRIERMVLDGVSSPAEFVYEFHEQQIIDSDKVFSHFFEACIDDPDHCLFASHGKTAKELEDKVWDKLEEVKYHPFSVNGTLYDYSKLKTGLMTAMYGPRAWSTAAKGLDALFTGNLTSFATSWAPLSASVTGDGNLNSIGIRCSDRYARLESFEEYDELLDKLHDISRFMGGAHSGLDPACAFWKMTAKERYHGNFTADTDYPVLLIGNTADLLTPIAAARNVSSTLEGSVVLHHDSYGHASVSHVSKCTVKAVADYYVNGTLPKKGTTCEPDTPPFQLRAPI